ncbi:hypothetical protein PoB_001415000 [Plakobranchus ocellatus]|uniref:Uncharacterized protein n=1 Tax=Plakobranchus ocellatus TaxID=259542 RepID=A0AAV3YXN8_9GAST|nr:hypothetical protein PoB_001415000 [Plakobranchus ocellatus]
MEVRRREPGVMIRQRLQNLRDQVVHGRRDSSEDRGHGYARSKSQPPSQYRSKLHSNSSMSQLSTPVSECSEEKSSSHSGHQHQCIDDISVHTHDIRLSGCRENLSLRKDVLPQTLWKSRDSLFAPPARDLISRSKERLNRSNDRLYGSAESLSKDKRSASLDLCQSESKDRACNSSVMSSTSNPRQNSNIKDLHHQEYPVGQHLHFAAQKSISSLAGTSEASHINKRMNCGHEHDAAARFFSSNSPQHDSASHPWHQVNQFVHRARSSSEQSTPSPFERSSSPGPSFFAYSNSSAEGIKISSSFCGPSLLERQPHQQQLSRSMDQLSTEVDNLVIMKGWVRSLISKFQEQP